MLFLSSSFFQKSFFYSHLSTRFLQQKADYIEASSMLPFLKKQISNKTEAELLKKQDSFLEIIDKKGKLLWKVSRSRLKGNKIQFTLLKDRKKIILTLPYKGEKKSIEKL